MGKSVEHGEGNCRTILPAPAGEEILLTPGGFALARFDGLEPRFYKKLAYSPPILHTVLTLKSLIREPLVHFLLLGAALFALDAVWRQDGSADAGGEIVLGEARINNLAKNFTRTWQRPPTSAELEGLIQDYVREEVFYREALALGLDRDDTIIRRRLRQKVEFVSNEAAELAQPTDQELADYLVAHPEAFRVEARATFAQVYLDPRRHGDALGAHAQQLLKELNRSGDKADPPGLGDSLLLLEPRYENVSESDVAKAFSADFAEALFQQPAGNWVGPIASGYGVHLVRVESITPGRVPALDEVRPLVEREWSNARRKEVNEAFYARLRAKYQVKITKPEVPAPGDGAAPARAQETAKP